MTCMRFVRGRGPVVSGSCRSFADITEIGGVHHFKKATHRVGKGVGKTVSGWVTWQQACPQPISKRCHCIRRHLVCCSACRLSGMLNWECCRHTSNRSPRVFGHKTAAHADVGVAADRQTRPHTSVTGRQAVSQTLALSWMTVTRAKCLSALTGFELAMDVPRRWLSLISSPPFRT